MLLTHEVMEAYVIHASQVHQSLPEAVREYQSRETPAGKQTEADIVQKIFRTILDADDIMQRNFGISSPLIRIASISHEGETATDPTSQRINRLIRRGVEMAKKARPSLQVAGPVSALKAYLDTIHGIRPDWAGRQNFPEGITIALYHDQGHIPLKLLAAIVDPAKQNQPRNYAFQAPAVENGRIPMGPVNLYLADERPLPGIVEDFEKHPQQMVERIFQAIKRAHAGEKSVQNPHP